MEGLSQETDPIPQGERFEALLDAQGTVTVDSTIDGVRLG